MNGLERIKCTLEGKIPDRVPMFDFLFQRDIFTEMIGLTPGDYDLCQVIDCCKALNLDMAAAMIGASDDFEFRIDGNGKYYDEWGTAYVRSASSWPIDAPVEFPVKKEEDFRKFKFPDPLAKGRLSNLRKGLACTDGSIAIM
ncbi:MAG: hypothetical protein LBB83_10790, partial [Treponema sp.]|nr:hypothetical protein [Treponema sp.]